MAGLPGGTLVARGDRFWGHPSPTVEPDQHKGRSPGSRGGQQFWVSGGNNGPQSSRPNLRASSSPGLEVPRGSWAPGRGVVRCRTQERGHLSHGRMERTEVTGTGRRGTDGSCCRGTRGPTPGEAWSLGLSVPQSSKQAPRGCSNPCFSVGKTEAQANEGFAQKSREARYPGLLFRVPGRITT